MLGGLDPHFRAWDDPFIGSIFEPGPVHFRACLDSLDLDTDGNYLVN